MMFSLGSQDGQSKPGSVPYGWTSARPAEHHAYVAPKVHEIVARLGATRVLDLGCGNGALSHELAARGIRVVGVEPDAEGIEIARSRDDRVDYLQASVDPATGAELSAYGPFDLVLSIEVVEHLSRPGELLDLAVQCLPPDGHLLISTPYHGYLKNLLLSLTNRWDAHWDPLWDGGHVKFFSRTTMSRLLARHGFELVAFNGAGRIPWLWKSMLILARPKAEWRR